MVRRLNVPDYSKYEYIVRGGDPDTGASGWLNPVGGTTDSIESLPEEWEQITIKWDGGPEVGNVVYMASPNFTWDLKVNVVGVSVSGFNWNDEGATPGNHLCGMYDASQQWAMAMSGNGVAGMIFAASVNLQGPLGGRGIRFIRGDSSRSSTIPSCGPTTIGPPNRSPLEWVASP